MADDRDVLKEVWEGKLPITFSLAEEDLAIPEHPEELRFMVPRVTYFPLILDKVHRYFQKYADVGNESEIWLESAGQPLKWHYPVGVLFDLYNQNLQLPWKLTVHFKNFPEEDLIHCPNREAVESMYMYTLKEADALKHRGAIINNMQRRDHKQLWSGLLNDRFEQFWSVNRKLMEPGSCLPGAGPAAIPSATSAGGAGQGPAAGPGGQSDGTSLGFRHVPFRLHFVDQPYKQSLTRPFSDDGQPVTFGDLLKEAVPDLVNSKYKFLVHGIEIPMDSHLQWLSEHLSYPDNFLHVSVTE